MHAVVSGAAFDDAIADVVDPISVTSPATTQHVGAMATRQSIVATPAGQGIVAAFTVQAVVTAGTGQHVVGRPADQDVIEGAAADFERFARDQPQEFRIVIFEIAELDLESAQQEQDLAPFRELDRAQDAVIDERPFVAQVETAAQFQYAPGRSPCREHAAARPYHRYDLTHRAFEFAVEGAAGAHVQREARFHPYHLPQLLPTLEPGTCRIEPEWSSTNRNQMFHTSGAAGRRR